MPWYLFLVLILSGLGILNAAYLSYYTVTKTPVRCLWFPPEWCRRVQESRFSRMFGIPNAFLGFALYGALFVSALANFAGAISFWPVTVLAYIGFLFSAYFTAIQGFVLRAYCTWCVLSAVDFLILFIIVSLVRG
jgi:uncharacterized membrane protein